MSSQRDHGARRCVRQRRRRRAARSAQQRTDHQKNGGRQEWCHDEPDENSSDGDEAKVFEKLPGIGAEARNEQRNMERDEGEAEQMFSRAIKWNEQRELQWVGEIVDQLDDRLIEPQRERGQAAEDRGRTNNREDAEQQAERDGERDLLRRDALLELIDDRGDDAPLPE